MEETKREHELNNLIEEFRQQCAELSHSLHNVRWTNKKIGNISKCCD
jgi:hypothetical protein